MNPRAQIVDRLDAARARTRALVARTSFRSWDYPIRRQIFSGLRLAADA